MVRAGAGTQSLLFSQRRGFLSPEVSPESLLPEADWKAESGLGIERTRGTDWLTTCNLSVPHSTAVKFLLRLLLPDMHSSHWPQISAVTVILNLVFAASAAAFITGK